MSVSDVELATLTSTHDIISLGMLADGERRRRHGVAHDVRARGEGVRRSGRAAAAIRPQVSFASKARRRPGRKRSNASGQAAAVAGGVPLSGYSLADLEQLAAREKR